MFIFFVFRLHFQFIEFKGSKRTVFKTKDAEFTASDDNAFYVLGTLEARNWDFGFYYFDRFEQTINCSSNDEIRRLNC